MREEEKLKAKEKKETYIHLNAEFQRIARRDKKAFCSDHRKEIEENNRKDPARASGQPMRKQEECTQGPCLTTAHCPGHTHMHTHAHTHTHSLPVRVRATLYTSLMGFGISLLGLNPSAAAKSRSWQNINKNFCDFN